MLYMNRDMGINHIRARRDHSCYGMGLGIIILDDVYPGFPGDVRNASAYPFPIQYEIVEGVDLNALVWAEDKSPCLEPIRRAAKKLERMGCRAIAAECGYYAYFQKGFTYGILNRLEQKLEVMNSLADEAADQLFTAIEKGRALDRQRVQELVDRGTLGPLEWWNFVDWSDASTDNPRTDTNVTADISVTANFELDTVTLTYTAGTGGSKRQ